MSQIHDSILYSISFRDLIKVTHCLRALLIKFCMDGKTAFRVKIPYQLFTHFQCDKIMLTYETSQTERTKKVKKFT